MEYTLHNLSYKLLVHPNLEIVVVSKERQAVRFQVFIEKGDTDNQIYK